MPKLIFTSHYLRDAPPEHLENYVRYIGTREGVEKIDESKLSLPATGNQKELIAQLIRDIPQTKELLEYADFLLRPTIGNASEFISCALEQKLCGLYCKPSPRGACGGAWSVHGCGSSRRVKTGAGGCGKSQRSGLDACHLPSPGGCSAAWV